MNLLLKIALGLIFLVAIGGLYFANMRLTSVARETSRLKAEVEVGQRQLVIYEQTKTKVDSLNYVDTLAAKVLPASEDQSLVVAELSQFAIRSNLKVAQISFAEASKEKQKSKAVPSGVAVTPISMQLQAGSRYTDLLAFLKLIEQNQRQMQITNLSLAPDAKDRSRLSEVTVDINLYSRKD